MSKLSEQLSEQLIEHIHIMQTMDALLPAIERATIIIQAALSHGNKILLCGNGGSAADAQHIAAEIVGRFEVERHALPAIALTTDSSILTAVANDYGYEQVFARQVQGLAVEGDVLIAYSTSGNSANIVQAVEMAKQKGCSIIALTGDGGGKLASLADELLAVHSKRTARIQEAHAFIGHVLCAAIDAQY